MSCRPHIEFCLFAEVYMQAEIDIVPRVVREDEQSSEISQAKQGRRSESASQN